MAKSRPSVQKRKMEAAKMEKKLAKEARKAAREAAKGARDGGEGIDPDLAGIVAGPQARLYEAGDPWDPNNPKGSADDA